jgi:ABC-2 type transport system ATP-binding protein
LINVRHLTKLYDNFPAVQDLNLEVAEGEIMGIIGHNGAGKTTTLKMLVGLIEPTSGEITIMGRDALQESTRIKQHIGYLPEESALYENMSARDYLLFFSRLYGLPQRVALERIDELLEALQLQARDRLTGEMSKGMRRKVAIARALLHDPDLLIFDEPNSGLDPLTSFFIINYLRALREQGKTILLSAHNLFHIEYICDRVAILKEGRLVICDRMENIRKELGQRQYQVLFEAPEALPFERQNGHYVVRTEDVAEIATILRRVADHGWHLVDLSVKESALEEIYVRLMSG